MKGRLALGLLAAALLAGCGSQTKTVTVAQSPTGATTLPSTTTATHTSTPATTPTSSAPPTSSSTSTTRTAPEPSFAEKEQEVKGGSLGAAVATLRERGYTPQNTTEYHSSQTLRVLVGTRAGDGYGDGYGQQAFFFLEGHFLGTDAKEPSAKLSLVSQNDTEVTIAYPLYRASDPLCCPGGGSRVVHFALNDGKLSALGTIPPAHSSTGLSRN